MPDGSGKWVTTLTRITIRPKEFPRMMLMGMDSAMASAQLARLLTSPSTCTMDRMARCRAKPAEVRRLGK